MSQTLSPPSPAAPAAAGVPARRARTPRGRGWIAAFFLLPALILLGALVVYPIVWSVIRSLFGPHGFTDFVFNWPSEREHEEVMRQAARELLPELRGGCTPACHASQPSFAP